MAILPHKIHKASRDNVVATRSHTNLYAHAILAFAAVLWIILAAKSGGVAELFNREVSFILGVPFILLWLAVYRGKPWSFSRALVYITTITSILFTFAFVAMGKFKGESVILLGIPIIVLWLGGFCAFLAAVFHSPDVE